MKSSYKSKVDTIKKIYAKKSIEKNKYCNKNKILASKKYKRILLIEK